MIDRFEKFSAAISDISRYWHKIAADEMEQYELKGPYSVYFTTLFRFPEGLTAAKLGELCSRDKADVSRAVSMLEKKQLIAREGRNYRAALRLTEQGRRLADQINKKAESAVALGGMGLTDEQREIFYSALERIAANLQKLSQSGLEGEMV